MTDQVTLTGMPFLAGKTVSAWIAGLDCGDYVVGVDGAINVPWASDPDQWFSPGWLNAMSLQGNYADLECQIDVTGTAFAFTAYVPCVVGCGYFSEGQAVRPATDSDLRGLKTPGFGVTRRSHMIGMLLKGQGLNVGTTFANVLPAQLVDTSGQPLKKGVLFDGVLWQPLPDNYSFDSEILWTIVRPFPCTVNGFTGFLEASER